jgi:hypothetical protein
MLAKLRICLVCVAGAIALWYVGRAVLLLSEYWQLSASVPASATQWEVRERSESEYLLEATYQYEVKGVSFSGKTLFEKPVYLNAYAATADLAKWKGQPWEVWIRPSHPEISSLERKFPAQALVHALLTLGVGIYFLVALNCLSKESRPAK